MQVFDGSEYEKALDLAECWQKPDSVKRFYWSGPLSLLAWVSQNKVEMQPVQLLLMALSSEWDCEAWSLQTGLYQRV